MVATAAIVSEVLGCVDMRHGSLLSHRGKQGVAELMVPLVGSVIYEATLGVANFCDFGFASPLYGEGFIMTDGSSWQLLRAGSVVYSWDGDPDRDEVFGPEEQAVLGHLELMTGKAIRTVRVESKPLRFTLRFADDITFRLIPSDRSLRAGKRLTPSRHKLTAGERAGTYLGWPTILIYWENDHRWVHIGPLNSWRSGRERNIYRARTEADDQIVAEARRRLRQMSSP